jgi:DNA mismatch endonuclease, patch repair protein
MSRIRGKDTTPEKAVRSLLHQLGYRFRLHVRKLPGCPDIVLPKFKTAIFVHGCFWHRHRGCGNCTTPTNRREWWLAKLNGNDFHSRCNSSTCSATTSWRILRGTWQTLPHPKTCCQSSIQGRAVSCHEFDAAFRLFRQMHDHPVEQTRPLRVARIQLLFGQFSSVSPPPRFGSETLEHARPAAVGVVVTRRTHRRLRYHASGMGRR